MNKETLPFAFAGKIGKSVYDSYFLNLNEDLRTVTQMYVVDAFVDYLAHSSHLYLPTKVSGGEGRGY